MREFALVRGAQCPSENKRKNPLPHGYGKTKGGVTGLFFCLALSLVLDAYSSEYLGTTLLVWSVFGNCAEPISPGCV